MAGGRWRPWAVVAGGVAAGITVAAAYSSAARPATANSPCSKTAAQGLVHDQVAGVLCGPFVGPGSQAMVVLVTNGTCLPSLDWSLFRRVGTSWQSVPLGPHGGYASVPPRAVGNQIEETGDIHRPGDPLCNPTGGTLTRLWHWNGHRLAAGPWRRTRAVQPTRHATFYWPGRRISCEMSDDPTRSIPSGVYCRFESGTHAVYLTPNGTISPCSGGQGQCVGSVPVGTPVLGYGRQIVVGRFRCRSERSGVTCTVAKTGRGFRINASGVRRLGP